MMWFHGGGFVNVGFIPGSIRAPDLRATGKSWYAGAIGWGGSVFCLSGARSSVR
jgi:hypothetical protein